jgi:hypothetical protein
VKWKATQLQVLYVTTQVMETSITRGRFKKLIGSGIDVGIAGIVIGMMTIDIRGALQNCGDIAIFETCVDICIVCILILYYPSTACINVYDMRGLFRSSSRYSLVFFYDMSSDLTYADQQGNSETL